MTAALASILFAAAWKGTLLVAFALLVHRVARNHVPPRWMCALLLVAFVRLLVPVAPEASFSVFNLVPSTETVTPAPIGLGAAPPHAVPPPPMRARVAVPPKSNPWMLVVLALLGIILYAIVRFLHIRLVFWAKPDNLRSGNN